MRKPSYIGLLNAVAVGERGGHQQFDAWCAATNNEELKKTLGMVAIREMEHSWAFEKRLSELGYDCRPSTDKAAIKDLEKRIKLLGSKASDAEKFALFGIGEAPATKHAGKKSGKKNGKQSGKKAKPKPQEDQLLKVLADKSIDPQTGALLGRFICEERDTGRALVAAYKACAQASAKAAKSGGKKKKPK